MASSSKRRVPLDDEALTDLVKEVATLSKQLDNYEIVEMIVCKAIMNMPRDVDNVMVETLVALVRKELSCALCRDRLNTLNKTISERNKEIIEKNLIIQYNQDPNNMEIRDELQRLAEKGSAKAKQCLGDAYVEPLKPTTSSES